jgi:hypothetical protein
MEAGCILQQPEANMTISTKGREEESLTWHSV